MGSQGYSIGTSKICVFRETTQGVRHAVSRLLPSNVQPSPRRPLVLQYELQHQHKDFGCGGGFLTLFATGSVEALRQLDESIAPAIVFGADMCGLRSEILFRISRCSPLTGKR